VQYILSHRTIEVCSLAVSASYALIATSTDYDAWRVDEHPVTVSEVLKTLHDNAETSRRVAGHILGQVHAMVEKKDVLTRAVESMKYSIITQPQFHTAEDRKKLAYILPDYFG
jgi:5'-methylthioadenosine phosphorylase